VSYFDAPVFLSRFWNAATGQVTRWYLSPHRTTVVTIFPPIFGARLQRVRCCRRSKDGVVIESSMGVGQLPLRTSMDAFFPASEHGDAAFARESRDPTTRFSGATLECLEEVGMEARNRGFPLSDEC